MRKLLEQPLLAANVLARLVGRGIEFGGDDIPVQRQQSQAKPAAERQNFLPRFPFLGGNGEINRVRHRLPVDALAEQPQVEGGFHLDNERSFLAANGDEIAGADLALHLIALNFEKALDRRIEIGFFHMASMPGGNCREVIICGNCWRFKPI